MAENKTKLSKAGVQDYLDAIRDEGRRRDCEALVKLMSKATNCLPAMWGTSIVGFGRYHYKYESGREGEMCLVGFSSRKGDISLYGLNGAKGAGGLLAKLGKHKAGKGCIYIKSFADVDENVLQELVTRSSAEKGGRCH